MFVLTIGTTWSAGVLYYLSFKSGLGTEAVAIDAITLAHGVIYSAAVLGILGAHEMGHYIACRLYDVDATLPYFLPFPLTISGTLGAVIKIREPFPSRKALFDIGVAGPIAGFVVLVPLLFFSIFHSTIVHTPIEPGSFSFGEPLLFKLAVWLKFGKIADGYQLNLHPIGFAAWFGMLATAINLLPFGQLDGGHLTHAAVGDSSRHISLATAVATLGLCLLSYTWIVIAAAMVLMLYWIGPRHPRPLDEYEPIGRARVLVAIFAIVMFVLCFMPIPFERM